MAYRFDVAFSFAGPHREKVRAIAEFVAAKLGREKVFFDEWYEDELGGDNAEAELQRIYEKRSLMVIADVSDKYADRPWCQAEASGIRALRMSIDTARDSALRWRLAYVRFDDGEVEGVLRNAITWDARTKTEQQIADLILSRLAKLQSDLALRATAATASPASLSPPLPVSPFSPPAAPKILFFHPATNDSLYSRRERELDWLDACARDPLIRIATVTGVGGLGKTSLVGHWIEVRKGWQHRAFHGVFFYSFYSDRDPQHFFDAFLDFAYESIGQKRPDRDGVLHHDAATLAQRWPFLVVLDGLEVLQADAEDSRYGWINDGSLNEFVSRLGEKGQSLLVLTSRFSFPKVTRQFTEHARPLELGMFSPEEGADLLEKCGIPEDREARMAFSTQFGGHPLALRLFVGASLTAPATDPSELSREVMRAEKSSILPDPNEPGIADGERPRRRHRRQFQKLLEWLQAKLPAPKRRLLQLVALFREPVPTATLAALSTGLDAMKADFVNCDSASISTMLDSLVRKHLLQRGDVPDSDTPRWAAHPIVREVFRAEALSAGETVAAQFAEIVAGKTEGGRPKNVSELEPILQAIEVLLASGDFRAADELYCGRLEDGMVFQYIPAPEEGLRCARGFVEPPERRAAMERTIGREKLGFYLNGKAVKACILGEIGELEQIFTQLLEGPHAEQSWGNLAASLLNLANVQTLRGELRIAAGTASESLF